MRSRPPFLLVALLALLAVGCGSGEQSYSDSKVVTRTNTEQLRQWLEGVEKTGQLDSGAETIKDTIDGMADEGVEQVDQLRKDAEELKKMKSPAAIRSQAKKMLGMLPDKASSSAE